MIPPSHLPPSRLADYLKKKDSALYGKLAQLRGLVERWLTYVPATFGHYTSHTLDHSDEIVHQMGWLLFGEHKKPVIELANVEIYILIAAAYLHDAGMVVSEAEKQAILASDDWKTWTTEGSGAKRWKDVDALRRGAGDDPLKHFAADRAVRLLIAEHVRRSHHRRAGELVRGRATELAQLDFDEPMLRNAIAEVCVAHGLDRTELEDDFRFPERRQIMHGAINLRLLATLLRLGDLLDLRNDRACPLLMQAACPLPADSVAHWTQYTALEHLDVSPEKIAIHARCRTQDEHRALHDWCTWLVREVESLPARLPKATQKWTPPVARMDGPSPTIRVEPAADATYVPGDWRFELDADAVFQRLVTDVYDSPDVFVRELIQNALDAMRCRMYADLEAAKQPLPDYPNDAPEDVRERYVLRVSQREEIVKREDTGETETVHVIVVDDCGLGMDTEIVRRYLAGLLVPPHEPLRRGLPLRVRGQRRRGHRDVQADLGPARGPDPAAVDGAAELRAHREGEPAGARDADRGPAAEAAREAAGRAGAVLVRVRGVPHRGERGWAGVHGAGARCPDVGHGAAGCEQPVGANRASGIPGEPAWGSRRVLGRCSCGWRRRTVGS